MSAIANESFKEAQNMQEEHHGGAAKYAIIWAALMVLTVVTVVTGRMHLPNWGLALALVIASVKGALVALYFMHLADHRGANRIVFITSMVFVVLMLLFTLFDIGTRFRPALAASGTPIAWPVQTGQSMPYSTTGTNEAPERRSHE
ncbi:cytochrome C oxidase subunit IV family protein [Cystobacter ferrugineus]|uniref:cytochrome C oxidase subunit IV family protein n=1 Tax=Cystobacter ferrugineus TaxID=83449 RepID=UPI00090455A9|nr:cytochrome C oxidase subunit IV family protein [Cystobacter ferrugineus]